MTTLTPEPTPSREELLATGVVERFESVELEICHDCFLFLAHGTGPEWLLLDEVADGGNTEARYDHRLAQLVGGVERVQAEHGGDLVLGGNHEICAESGRVHHSRQPCDSCQVADDGDGDRYAATVLVPVYPTTERTER